ncbi:enoyl-CoA hydratase [Cytobacillus purgationiresistens]|uniref:Acyl dehydratase n=1 Tax=Cytobacillus purgationiresistens TaxID=863449 RepID=A0ABU0ALU9_9BACI|nr:enoyl-CoA hydratase [Cytobacillus purgationiresistens]MDQ0271716.1 acyl dehydratase [Cytobacillus purgationiresistens]
MSLQVGDTISFQRTFTKEDVALFTKVSWDEGSHHTTPDEQGRLVIQGLLTATLPTKIGGENNVLAHTMNFKFLKPVFTDDTIVCEATIEKYDKKENGKISMLASFNCMNQHRVEVMSGNFAGVILELGNKI